MNFHRNGEFLVTASDDSILRMYSIPQGKEQRVVKSQKHGSDLVRFAHLETNVLYASNNGHDNSIRFLSFHDNQYLRYFKGHRDRVVSMEMNPLNDYFLSASLDNTVRLWDLRTSACQGLMNVGCRSSVAFDTKGLVFCVSTAEDLKMYDSRAFDRGPFSTFPLPQTNVNPSVVGCIKFSPAGDEIMLSYVDGSLALIDGFNGTLKSFPRKSQNFKSLTNVYEGTFSPDGKFFCVGHENGSFTIYECQTGRVASALDGHPGPTTCVHWNPRMNMIASACTALAFWIPVDE
eukprot:TRINITY_DN4417_c0_g1_i1.p1 TRINITY_DN4417_c0_g1~~TRINITY_DN4417_c0_g1_i1.p1  ORF type:complete len:319 (-),score=51.42 TRINITY_DN4417_c0_g1_i1:14-883(-)